MSSHAILTSASLRAPAAPRSDNPPWCSGLGRDNGPVSDADTTTEVVLRGATDPSVAVDSACSF